MIAVADPDIQIRVVGGGGVSSTRPLGSLIKK